MCTQVAQMNSAPSAAQRVRQIRASQLQRTLKVLPTDEPAILVHGALRRRL